MSVILTNGATALIYNDSDFQVLRVPPWQTPQTLLGNSVGLPRAHTLSGGRNPRALSCQLSMYGDDKSTTFQGYDALEAFYEGTGVSGVDGIRKTFMITDDLGRSYQARFVDDLGAGLTENTLNVHLGNITLQNVHTLPTDEPSGLEGWWAAYDMDNNGGNMLGWAHNDGVGGVGEEWMDKSGNGFDGANTNATFQPNMDNTTGSFPSRLILNFEDTGGADFLDLGTLYAAWDGLNGQPFSWYGVIGADAFDTTGDAVMSFGNTSGAQTDRLLFAQAKDDGGGSEDFEVEVDDNSTTKTVTSTDQAPDGADTRILSIISDGSTLQMYSNGSQIITDGDVDISAVDYDNALIGAYADSGTKTRGFVGQVGEIIIFSEEHNDLQRRRQELRLSDMWDVALIG